MDKMRKMIEKVAPEKKFTICLEKREQNVLFAQKDADLTEDGINNFEAQK